MKNIIIVTGAHGFLGRHCAAAASAAGFEIYGIGHGSWPESEYSAFGIKKWISSDITCESLCALNSSGRIAALIHCGGGSSVAYSLEYPSLDHQKTVGSTLGALEYLRRENPDAHFIYPSSTAVYGAAPDAPITENRPRAPISPYGFNKAAAELLCECYYKNYSIKCHIIRFFSIYGAGLKKQLLWDACNKITGTRTGGTVKFFGTGEETRDWIEINDAAALVLNAAAAGPDRKFEIINGGTGIKTTIKNTISTVADELAGYGISGRAVEFINRAKAGDPSYYLADTAKVFQTGWKPAVKFKEGAARYVRWFVKTYL